MIEGRSVIIRASDDGPETVVAATRKEPGSVRKVSTTGRYASGLQERTFRQIGWLGQTGNVYRFDEEADAQDNEPCSYGPLYIEVTE